MYPDCKSTLIEIASSIQMALTVSNKILDLHLWSDDSLNEIKFKKLDFEK